MKKHSFLFLALIGGMILIAGFTIDRAENEHISISGDGIVIDIPKDVKAVIDKSCYACHNKASKNEKGKLKLKFEKFTKGEYSPGKAVGKLNGIVETLEKGDMPPEKFLQKYPDKKPSEKEMVLVKKWAKDAINKLLKE